jgi:DEAD/DEAH box helicase domain-containing protein
VRRIDCDYYTDAISHTKVTILDTFEVGSAPSIEEARPVDAASAAAGLERKDMDVEVPELPSGFAVAPPGGVVGDDTRAHGEVHVSSRVVGFKKIKFYTNENVGSGDLDLPEQQMHTTAYWLTVPQAVVDALPYAPDDRRDGVVGLSFAMRQVAQLLLMCDRQDVGVAIGSGDESDEGKPPRIFIYDNYPGGIGFSQPLFAMHSALLARTRAMIAGCPCERGCPTCVGPIGDTGPLAKLVALRILDLLAKPVRVAGDGPSFDANELPPPTGFDPAQESAF